MKERIKEVMESQHMTQQVFANFIEMSPASLSSIFTGRTRPTINIVEAIKKKIPDLNTDWLMFGIGEMYSNSSANSGKSSEGVSEGIEPMLNFAEDQVAANPQQAVAPSPFSGEQSSVLPFNHPSSYPHQPVREVIKEEIKVVEKPQRKITEIRIYFDDLTFETFVPAKK
ncbi:MAG: helix-turn-helix domain-containing protein [Prevotella sp.]